MKYLVSFNGNSLCNFKENPTNYPHSEQSQLKLHLFTSLSN